DEVARGSMLRLVEAWRPSQFHELFLDGDGVQARPPFVELCSRPYNRENDINLGGVRAKTLLELTGETAWRELCELIAFRAVEQIHGDRRFKVELVEARNAANEHFEMVTLRLRARGRQHGEDSETIVKFV